MAVLLMAALTNLFLFRRLSGSARPAAGQGGCGRDSLGAGGSQPDALACYVAAAQRPLQDRLRLGRLPWPQGA
eukprot:5409600-Pleurochrysis_carterae.AAC.1